MAITVYSERYVAFLDILGFSDIVRRSTTLPEKATELIAILEDIANANQQFVEDMQLPTDDFKAQSFSDCIVLSENASPIGLFHLLASVTMLSSARRVSSDSCGDEPSNELRVPNDDLARAHEQGELAQDRVTHVGHQGLGQGRDKRFG